jgi:hypothetical protein
LPRGCVANRSKLHLTDRRCDTAPFVGDAEGIGLRVCDFAFSFVEREVGGSAAVGEGQVRERTAPQVNGIGAALVKPDDPDLPIGRAVRLEVRSNGALETVESDNVGIVVDDEGHGTNVVEPVNLNRNLDRLAFLRGDGRERNGCVLSLGGPGPRHAKEQQKGAELRSD